jgi:hypothetical protein
VAADPSDSRLIRPPLTPFPIAVVVKFEFFICGVSTLLFVLHFCLAASNVQRLNFALFLFFFLSGVFFFFRAF